MNIVENQTFDEERAFYGANGLTLQNCRFDGPADGESALKESRDVVVRDCFWNLRYPFWHDKNLRIYESELTELCRAALWYSKDITIVNTKLHGIKALRECKKAVIAHSDIISPEFGWSSVNVAMENCMAKSEYFMFRARKLRFDNVEFSGKYSFQYIKNSTFNNCNFNTKDAFWHAKNVVVKDSVLKGEYLAWYAENITFIRCKIIGTQPLCYCKGLKMVDCEMIDCDLSFEKSSVNATLVCPIDSIKNPKRGKIRVPAVGEIIHDDPKAKGKIEIV